MKSPHHITKILTLSAILAVLVFVVSMAHPKPAQAQLGSVACNATLNISNAVPVYDQATQAQKNVTCTANGIVWQIAHVVLQQLTTSVVNWINSGFNGSPSFLTNPETFFANTADQVTGAFIASTGLQALCSPFSLDIRLSLALGVTAAGSGQQYSCTLSKVIATQQGNVQRLQNGTLVTGSVSQSAGGATLGDMMNGNVLKNSNQLSINGNSVASVGGFIGGDFSQGGLTGFLALTTEPQNNPYGASLRAQSDLQMQILAKQNSVNNDLNRGGGFLSWQKCDSVPVGGTASSGGNTDPYGQEYNPTPGKTNADPLGTKQVCTTQTPGSVISASLNKQLGAPTDELNLTNEINQVVSALFSQLVSHVLSNGLLGSSQSTAGSNVTQSYVNQLSNDPQLQTNFVDLKQQSAATLDAYTTPIQQSVSLLTQAVGAMNAEQQNFIQARACIQSLSTKTTVSGYESVFQSDLSAIDATIANDIVPELSKYQSALSVTQSALTQIQNMESQVSSASSATDLQSLNSDFSSQVSTELSNAVDPQTAQSDLTAANKTAVSLQTTLRPYQSACATGVPSF